MRRLVMVRSEINASVGMGHAMRCLWIAKALSDLGDDAVVCSETSSAIEGLARIHGVRRLPVAANRPPVAAEDALALLAHRPDLVVVDSPKASPVWADVIGAGQVPLVVISGEGGPRLEANGCIWPESCPVGSAPVASQAFVCGEQYVPLAPEYWNGARCKDETGTRRILVTFGGVDHYDISSEAIRALDEVASDKCTMRVIVGAFYDNVSQIERAAAASRHEIELVHQPQGLHAHLTWSDFAICAGGTTLYEMCALGVPGVGIAVWPLQQAVVDSVVGAGGALGIVYENPEQLAGDLRRALMRLRTESGLLESLGAAGSRHIDGRGAMRIAEWLKQF
jgi:spore coat polysaccharide biosynthesis predicted glycosyltransferase SpsG